MLVNQMSGKATKVTIVCPKCEKKKLDLEFKDGDFKQVKGKKWNSLMRQDGPSEWVKDWRIGVVARCDCNHNLILYNLENNAEGIVIEDSIKEGQFVVWFCDDCNNGYVTNDMMCPQCSHES